MADQNNDRVEKFDSNGTFLLAFGGPGTFNGPGHMAIDPQGNPMIVDEGNYRVVKYSPRARTSPSTARSAPTPASSGATLGGRRPTLRATSTRSTQGAAARLTCTRRTALSSARSARGHRAGQWQAPRGSGPRTARPERAAGAPAHARGRALIGAG